ncbi:MAG: 1-deoxy-D-xylulose-5-phosphate synthase [bacterium]
MKKSLEIQNLKTLTVPQLRAFADRAREEMIDIVSGTGGHIGVNVGVLEITLALHHVFDFPRDHLIFDTGHNCYAHKMLTGRLEKLRTMRRHGGLSGFPNPKESEFDLVSSSHAGTGLSLGLGLAVAEKMSGGQTRTITLVGDGSLVEGASQEALNHIGATTARLLIVLNDNGIAIDPWDGGLYRYLARLRSGARDTYFSALGLDYVGPIDGHDLQALVETFTRLKNISKPTLVHCLTRKGHGLPWRQDDPNQNHWLFPYDEETGAIIENGKEYWMKPSQPFLNSVAARTIYDIVKNDSDAVVISPATNGISGIQQIFRDFPDQTIDVAMAEQHAIIFAVGLALKRKKKPIVCFQSAFLPRAFDQLIQDLALNRAPVLIVNTRSGIAGLDHDVHHALFDISYLTPIPQLEVLFPASSGELEKTIVDAYEKLTGPTMVLYAYGLLGDLDMSEEEQQQSRLYGRDARLAIVTTGNTHKHGFGLQTYLFEHAGIGAVVTNMTQLAPRDEKQLFEICQHYPFILSLEENVLRGGLGSILAEFICDQQLSNKLIRVGTPNCFMEKGLRSYLYPKHGMDYASILARIEKTWGKHLNQTDVTHIAVERTAATRLE